MRKFANFKPCLSQFANNIYANAVVSVIVVLDIFIFFLLSLVVVALILSSLSKLTLSLLSTLVSLLLSLSLVLLSFLLPLLLLLKSFAENLVFVCHHHFIFSEFSLPSSNRQVFNPLLTNVRYIVYLA